MHHRTRGATTGALLALAGASAAACAVALGLAARAGLGAGGPLRVDDVVLVAVAVLGALVCAWLALACGLGAACVAGRVLGARWRAGEDALRRCAPAVVRRVVAGVAGAGIGVGLVATGAGATAPPLVSSGPSVGTVATAHVWSPGTGAADLRGADGPALGWSVAVTDGESRTDAPGHLRATAHADARGEVHRVRAGESLWTIAATHLGDDATPERIAEAWPAWWEANRETIGSDPDVIRPGQVLQVPAEAAR